MASTWGRAESSRNSSSTRTALSCSVGLGMGVRAGGGRGRTGFFGIAQSKDDHPGKKQGDADIAKKSQLIRPAENQIPKAQQQEKKAQQHLFHKKDLLEEMAPQGFGSSVSQGEESCNVEKREEVKCIDAG